SPRAPRSIDTLEITTVFVLVSMYKGNTPLWEASQVVWTPQSLLYQELTSSNP
ncbi:hypothetical protein P7K49_039676, partial [Saguinus oedipus]